MYIPYIELTSTDITKVVSDVHIPVHFGRSFITKLTKMLPSTPTIVYYPPQYVETTMWLDAPIADGYNEYPSTDFNRYSYVSYEIPIQPYSINLIHDNRISDDISYHQPYNNGYLIVIGNTKFNYYLYACAIMKCIMKIYNINALPLVRDSMTTNYGMILSYNEIKKYHYTFWGEEMQDFHIPYSKEHFRKLSTYLKCFFISKQPIETVSWNGQIYDPFEKIEKN